MCPQGLPLPACIRSFLFGVVVMSWITSGSQGLFVFYLSLLRVLDLLWIKLICQMCPIADQQPGDGQLSTAYMTSAGAVSCFFQRAGRSRPVEHTPQLNILYPSHDHRRLAPPDSITMQRWRSFFRGARFLRRFVGTANTLHGITVTHLLVTSLTQ